MTETPCSAFQFSLENQAKVETYLAQYPDMHKQSALVPLLDLAQRQCGGWLPQPAIVTVAELVEIPFLKALEVVSFYTMFNLKPIGSYHVQICGTTPCWLRGSDYIQQACTQHLGIDLNETTADQLFTLSEVECLGACIKAPMVQINDNFYEDLTPESIVEILQDLANKSKKAC
jgi:NADH-quinone oxidoreductase subunit E